VLDLYSGLQQPDWHKRWKSLLGTAPCLLCGRPVKLTSQTAWVHQHNGGASIVTEEEAAELDPRAEMGWWPIGPDCLKSHPELKPYVQRVPLDPLTLLR